MSAARHCCCCSFHVLLFFLFLVSLAKESRGSVTCPPACACEKEEVRCENSQSLTELPQRLPSNDTLTSLLVTRVNITTITFSSFPYLRRLTTLDLHNNKIETLADGAFINLHQLKTLILRRNLLKQLSNQTFSGLEGLRALDLSWNCFTELHHRWFQPLVGLEVLDLARNAIKLIQADAFVGLTHLQVLNLTQNQLVTVSNSYMSPLKSLRTFLLDDNSIRSIENGSFSSQSLLTRLWLRGNRELRVVRANAFVSPPQVLLLEQLSLKGTSLREVPVDMLKSVPALKVLDLSKTAISVVKGRSFSTQGNLLNLTLHSLPKLTTIEAEAFTGLLHLETLIITNNPILTNVSRGVFRNLTHLHYLDLYGNAVETFRSGQARWQDIEIVDLRGNPIRCDCHTAWILDLLKRDSNESHISTKNSTCPESTTHQQDGSTTRSTAEFTNQIRCHMPLELNDACLSSLTADQFRCPQSPSSRVSNRSNDRRLIVAVVAAGATAVFLVTCGLVLKFRRRLCNVCNRQYRYRAHHAHWNNGVNGNGTSPSVDIVELETTQLEEFDSDPDT